MDQDKNALPQKRRKVEVDVKGIKKLDGQVPTNVQEGVYDPGVSDSFFSLGDVSASDLAIDFSSVFDERNIKDNHNVSGGSRKERNISSKLLADDCANMFRVTYTSNSLLEDPKCWQALREDLKVIGFLKMEMSGLQPLFLSKYVFSTDIYHSILLHLPLRYAARLSLLRFFGKYIVGHVAREQSKIELVNKICQFFKHDIVVARKKVSSRRVPDFSKNGEKISKLRIEMPTELAANFKTWRPRVSLALQDSFLKSFSKLKDNIECLSGDYFNNRKCQREDFYVKKSVCDAVLLSGYIWTDKDELAAARHRFLCGILLDIDLCTMFVLKQMFGQGQCMKDVCKIINDICTMKASSKMLHDDQVPIKRKIVVVPNKSGREIDKITSKYMDNNPTRPLLETIISDPLTEGKLDLSGALKARDLKVLGTKQNLKACKCLKKMNSIKIQWELAFLIAAITSFLFETLLLFNKITSNGLKGFDIVNIVLPLFCDGFFCALILLSVKHKCFEQPKKNLNVFNLMQVCNMVSIICGVVIVSQRKLSTTTTSCKIYSCYAPTSLAGQCKPCTPQNYCILTKPGRVSLCRAYNSSEFPLNCGPKYCNVLYDDCHKGGGKDGVFLGFARDDGGLKLCSRYFEIVVVVYGYIRVIYALGVFWWGRRSAAALKALSSAEVENQAHGIFSLQNIDYFGPTSILVFLFALLAIIAASVQL